MQKSLTMACIALPKGTGYDAAIYVPGFSMHVVDSLAPVFLILALGAVLHAIKFFPPSAIAVANRLTYWVGLPALFFREIANSSVALADHGDAIAAMLLGTLAAALAAYAIAALMKIPWESTGTFVQCAFRGNLAFIGLPVIIYSTSASVGQNILENPVEMAVILLAITIPIYNVASVIILLASKHRLGWEVLPKIGGQLATNPLILACAAGGLYGWLAPGLPISIDRTLAALGGIASPLALLAIGGSLRLHEIRQSFRAVLGSSLVKVALAPLAGWLLVRWLGLNPAESFVVLILLACPAAAASYVLTDQIDGDRELAAGAVAMGTLLSLVSLSVIVLLT